MDKRPVKNLSCIIVHHTATPQDYNVDDIRHIHQAKGYADVGYHWLVGQRGPKHGRNINFKGAHTKGEKINKKREKQGLPWISFNSIGIGIALIGSFEKNDPPERLVEYAADTIKRVAEQFGIRITRETIKGHNWYDWTACPGKNTMELIYKQLGI